MITSGRLALLFDGFDELELRVGYANAADYLQVLLESVTDRAKVVLTSRTQHFLSAGQLRTALGDKVAMRVREPGRRARGLLRLPGAAVPDRPLRRRQRPRAGAIRPARRDPRPARAWPAIPGCWPSSPSSTRTGSATSSTSVARSARPSCTGRSSPTGSPRKPGASSTDVGCVSFDEKERLRACTALALRLWTSSSAVMELAELSGRRHDHLDQAGRARLQRRAGQPLHRLRQPAGADRRWRVQRSCISRSWNGWSPTRRRKNSPRAARPRRSSPAGKCRS